MRKENQVNVALLQESTCNLIRQGKNAPKPEVVKISK